MASSGGDPTANASEVVSTGAGASSEKTLTAEMAEEIETTVMWVQQLLESVHFAQSEDVLEPGSSLLTIVQPGRRQQKDLALQQSMNLFHEKKEGEQDAEDETALLFRDQALNAVQAQRKTPVSRAGSAVA